MLFVPFCGLKNKLRSELNVARVIALRRHQTESRIWRCRRARIQTHARSEVRVIERIQSLGAKLEPASFAHTEILRKRRFATEYGWLRKLSSVVGTLRMPNAVSVTRPGASIADRSMPNLPP